MTVFKGHPNTDDDFVGGAGRDRFLFRSEDLDANDTISGGDGFDTLVLRDGGDVTAAALAGVTGIECVRLSDAGNGFAATDGLVQSAGEKLLKIIGGGAADVVSGAALTDASGKLGIFGGDGDDTLTGGVGDDTIDGGSGADRLDGGAGNDRIGYDALDHAIAGGDGYGDVLLVTGAASIDLTKADQSLGDAAVVTGFEQVDASRSHDSVTLVGGDDAVLTGGSGADVISAGGFATIEGGDGADRCSATGELTQFIVRKGQFVSGDVIAGANFENAIRTDGSIDFRVGSFGGISYLRLEGAAYPPRAHVSVELSGSQAASLESIDNSSIFGETKIDLTITADTKQLDLTGVSFGLRDDDVLTVQGTDAADRLVIPGLVAGHAVAHGGLGDDLMSESVGTGGTSVSPLLLGEDGNDFLQGNRMNGGTGDDRLHLLDYADRYSVDGGVGIDTLFGSDDTPQGDVVTRFNLASLHNQLRSDNQFGEPPSSVVRGIENIDWSANPNRLDVHGSEGANALAGGTAVDRLDGAGGDDLLDGGNSAGDRLTGGEGADTFRWEHRLGTTDEHDSVTDFTAGADKLAFSAATFDIAGKHFDTRVVETSTATSITGADLVVVTDRPLNGTGDVASYLSAAKGGGVDQGVFLLGTDAAGHTLLFHADDASFQHSTSVVEIADLGTHVKALDIGVADFSIG